MPRCGGDVARAGESQEVQGDVANGRHDLGCGAFSDLGAVLVEGDIPYPVELVLNAPVFPMEIEQPGSIGATTWKAGDAEVDLMAPMCGSVALLDLDVRFYPEYLTNVGECDVVTGAGAVVGPDPASLDATVAPADVDKRRGKKTPNPCSRWRCEGRVGCP